MVICPVILDTTGSETVTCPFIAFLKYCLSDISSPESIFIPLASRITPLVIPWDCALSVTRSTFSFTESSSLESSFIQPASNATLEKASSSHLTRSDAISAIAVISPSSREDTPFAASAEHIMPRITSVAVTSEIIPTIILPFTVFISMLHHPFY